MTITSGDACARYQRDGFFVAAGLYGEEEMLAWKQELQRLLAETPGHEVSGVRVWMARTLSPMLLRAMGDDKVTPILEKLIGPNVEFLSAKAVYKNGQTRFGSPFHQDWFYWEGATKLSVWIALDDATEANGCLLFVPGSHRRLYPKQVRNDGIAFVNRIADEDLAGDQVQTMTCKRGDAVFFHDLLVHGSHPNSSGGDRWSLISTYRDASVVDSSTVWAESLVIRGQSVNANAHSAMAASRV